MQDANFQGTYHHKLINNQKKYAKQKKENPNT